MVIALHGMIQLFSNSTRTYIFRQHIKKNVIKNFSIGALIGATISGLIIFILIQNNYLAFAIESNRVDLKCIHFL